MFGYVKPVVSELLVKEHEFYRATYCGICRAMKKHTGTLSNVTLSYDSVLLALVRMLFIPDEEIKAKMQRCIAHPVKKRCMLVENPATEYTARAFALLTYYKAQDDATDEGACRKMLLLPTKPVLVHARKRASLSELEDVIFDRLEKITQLERENTKSVDEGADLFGELLGEVFSHGLCGSDKTVCHEFGYHLGRFIYSADAVDDYEEDLKKGRYNPYVLLYDGKTLTKENKENIKCALILECQEMERAVDLMPFGTREIIEGIVRNIIYLGLIKRIDFLDGQESECPTKKQRRKGEL